MSRRTRKLIGLIVILVYLTLYALAVMSLAVRVLPDNAWVSLSFYIVTGMAWIAPMRPLLHWMERPDGAKDAPASGPGV